VKDITADMSVEYILENWPETAFVFNQDLKTACVGCPIAPFDTLEDVARIYNFDLDHILALMQEAAARPRQTTPADTLSPAQSPK
jgi:hybrid cluster-associated redox disulfide protein